MRVGKLGGWGSCDGEEAWREVKLGGWGSWEGWEGGEAVREVKL